MDKYYLTHLKHIKTQSDFSGSFLLINLIFIGKIITLIFKKEEKKRKVNYIFEEKNESIMTEITEDTNKIKNDNDKNKVSQIKKRKNIINDNNTINRNFIIIILIKFMIMNIYCKIKRNILFDLFNPLYSSTIKLKIKGIGNSYLFGNEVGNNFTGIKYLKEVKINGNVQDTIKYIYNFNQKDNLVELLFDDNINNCSCMFRKCSNITEIDLSNFKTSHVVAVNRMFSSRHSLTSLDSHNFDTPQVKIMYSMFFGCSPSTSSDLSNFDTSKVTTMNGIF